MKASVVYTRQRGHERGKAKRWPGENKGGVTQRDPLRGRIWGESQSRH